MFLLLVRRLYLFGICRNVLKYRLIFFAFLQKIDFFGQVCFYSRQYLFLYKSPALLGFDLALAFSFFRRKNLDRPFERFFRFFGFLSLSFAGMGLFLYRSLACCVQGCGLCPVFRGYFFMLRMGGLPDLRFLNGFFLHRRCFVFYGLYRCGRAVIGRFFSPMTFCFRNVLARHSGLFFLQGYVLLCVGTCLNCCRYFLFPKDGFFFLPQDSFRLYLGLFFFFFQQLFQGFEIFFFNRAVMALHRDSDFFKFFCKILERKIKLFCYFMYPFFHRIPFNCPF